MPLTFIHAADFHIGADLNRFGQAREKLRQAQFQALEKTLQYAADEKAAFVLICGDLFDSRRPSPGIVRRTEEIFSSFPDIPIYIIPGTHDFISENSIYAGPGNFGGNNVFIFRDPENSPQHLPEFDCCLYCKPNHSNRSTISPIAGLHRGGQGRFHIGMAHGSLCLGHPGLENDFPITPDEIEKSELDYLALGHWHSRRVEKFGKTTTAYPGIGQPLSWSDPSEGAILLVRLQDTGDVETSPRPVSTITFREIRATIYHPREISDLLEKVTDFNTVVKLALKYSDTLEETLETEKIIKEASSRYLLVQTEDKNSTKRPVSIHTPDKINEQFIEAFKAELTRMKDADSPERSELYRKAAELGITIITGEEK